MTDPMPLKAHVNCALPLTESERKKRRDIARQRQKEFKVRL